MYSQPQNIRPTAPRPAPLRVRLPDREGGSLFRDARFIHEEEALDSMLVEHFPELAIPMAGDLFKEVEVHSHVPEGLARIAFKAIAIAQSARQYYGNDNETDNTYGQIGILLDKTLQERDYLRSVENLHAIREGERMTGLISEMTVYALAAYDADLAKPLTQRLRGAQPRYILPSTMAEDQGSTILKGSKRGRKKNGIDLKVTYLNGEEPHRYIQVKTTPNQEGSLPYDSRVTVVAMTKLLSHSSDLPMTLARTVSNDALGKAQARGAHQRLNTASQRLNRMIQ